MVYHAVYHSDWKFFSMGVAGYAPISVLYSEWGSQSTQCDCALYSTMWGVYLQYNERACGDNSNNELLSMGVAGYAAINVFYSKWGS